MDFWAWHELREEDEAAVEVKYYDTLEAESAHCRDRAKRVLEALELPHKVPERSNSLRQKSFANGGTSCGFFVLHYAEQAIRQWHRETGLAPFNIQLKSKNLASFIRQLFK